jgi:hypothetical protein
LKNFAYLIGGFSAILLAMIISPTAKTIFISIAEDAFSLTNEKYKLVYFDRRLYLYHFN